MLHPVFNCRIIEHGVSHGVVSVVGPLYLIDKTLLRISTFNMLSKLLPLSRQGLLLSRQGLLLGRLLLCLKLRRRKVSRN